MKWSLLGRRCQRGLSVCILSSPCWQNDIPHDWNAPWIWFPPLQHTIYHIQMISDSESKISSLQSSFHLPTADECCHGRSVVSSLKKHQWLTSKNSSISISFSWLWLWKEVFVCTPCGYRKVCFTPHYPALELWPATYSLLIIAFCCSWVALVTYRQPCWPTSLLPCVIHKK